MYIKLVSYIHKIDNIANQQVNVLQIKFDITYFLRFITNLL